MTAHALIRDLADTGIRLSVTGDKLHVEAPVGTVTPELRLVLTEHKAELLAALSGSNYTCAHLLALAASEYMDTALVHRLPDADIAACASLPDEMLLAYLRTLAADAERNAGRVPHGDTAPVLCRSCGPVYLHPSIAAVLPVVGGWPRALGCPWCFIAKDGRMAIPRPPVRCGDCANFILGSVNPAGGWGGCKVGIKTKRLPYPFTEQHCGRFAPVGAGQFPVIARE